MDGGPAVLILTQPFDVTTDYVVDELHRRGISVFRCDPGDFPHDLELAADLTQHDVPCGGWTGSLRTAGREIDLNDVCCAWYRRPSAFEFPAELHADERRWAAHEARLGLGGVLASLPRWLNHPSNIARAEYKPVQLRCADAVGLTVPATAITNNPAIARQFTERHARVVYKPLSAAGIAEDGRHKLVYANRIEADDITDTVAATAHLFQEWVDKAYEVRLTVVDDTFFAVRIDAGTPAAFVDWRTDYEQLHYTAVEVPAQIRRRVLALLGSLTLRFAALDFVVTPDDKWVFLEANPNGQWAWLQDETGLPIAAAIADALTTEAHR